MKGLDISPPLLSRTMVSGGTDVGSPFSQLSTILMCFVILSPFGQQLDIAEVSVTAVRHGVSAPIHRGETCPRASKKAREYSSQRMGICLRGKAGGRLEICEKTGDDVILFSVTRAVQKVFPCHRFTRCGEIREKAVLLGGVRVWAAVFSGACARRRATD